MTGPPAMPFPWFEEDENLYLLQEFCSHCCKQGVFFHPHHNWFLCAAHTESDIAQATEAASRAFAMLSKEKI